MNIIRLIHHSPLVTPRSQALLGNARRRSSASRPSRNRTRNGVSRKAFPSRAWERGVNDESSEFILHPSSFILAIRSATLPRLASRSRRAWNVGLQQAAAHGGEEGQALAMTGQHVRRTIRLHVAEPGVGDRQLAQQNGVVAGLPLQAVEISPGRAGSGTPRATGSAIRQASRRGRRGAGLPGTGANRRRPAPRRRGPPPSARCGTVREAN